MSNAMKRGAAIFLVVLGTAQMLGDLTGVLPLKAIAAATGASPAPKVFSAVRGLETYSTRFFLRAHDGRRIEAHAASSTRAFAVRTTGATSTAQRSRTDRSCRASCASR